VTFLGGNVYFVFKVVDQIVLEKFSNWYWEAPDRIIRCKGDPPYGTNIEVRFRETAFPKDQDILHKNIQTIES
jgi:hypothetical protein